MLQQPKEHFENAASNILNSINTIAGKVTYQIASGLLKKKTESMCSNTSFSNIKHKNVSLQLATQGSISKVLLNPKIKEPTFISHESLLDLQIGLGNLSDNKMRKVSNWVRTHVGRKSIPVGFKEVLSAKSSLLSEEFSVEEAEFDGNGDKGKVIRPVIYADCENMVNRICKEEDTLVFQM